jgi:hypothetical protein
VFVQARHGTAFDDNKMEPIGFYNFHIIRYQPSLLLLLNSMWGPTRRFLASIAGMDDGTSDRLSSGQAKHTRDQPTRPEDGPMTGSINRARRRRSTVAPVWETGGPSATSSGDQTSLTTADGSSRRQSITQPSSMRDTAGTGPIDTTASPVTKPK